MRFKNVKLSKRQEAILALVATGHTKDEIADKLFIAPVTVATHIQMINQGVLGSSPSGTTLKIKRLP